jgi:hypothetical protein
MQTHRKSPTTQAQSVPKDLPQEHWSATPKERIVARDLPPPMPTPPHIVLGLFFDIAIVCLFNSKSVVSNTITEAFRRKLKQDLDSLSGSKPFSKTISLLLRFTIIVLLLLLISTNPFSFKDFAFYKIFSLV